MLVGISGKKQSGKNTVALIWQYLYDYYYNNYKHPITVEDFKEYVKNNHHLKSVWIQKSFAHKIKQIMCILLGCTMEQLEDPTFKETPLGKEWVKYKLSYVSYSRLSYCSCSDYYEKYFCSKEEAIEYINGNLEIDQNSIKISKIELTPRLLLQVMGTQIGREIIHPNLWVSALFSNYKPIIVQESEEKTSSDGGYYSIPNIKEYPNWLISDVRFKNEAKAIKDRGGILIRVDRDSDSKDSHVSENDLDTYKDWNYVIDNNYSLAELILRVRQIMFKEGIIYE